MEAAAPPGPTAAGLTAQEARRRLTSIGPNRLEAARRASILRVFMEEVREPMILLLLATGVLYSIWGEPVDAVTIFAVILALVGVEVLNDHRAERAMAALRWLAEPSADVLRDGQPVEIPVEEVVPGDLVLLRAGRRVAADARLVEAYGLAVDESPLTGESFPVEKAVADEPPEAPLAERRGTVFAGTTVVRGRGAGEVVATGMRTELGTVAGLAREAEAPRTPLQAAMRDLSRYLVALALTFSVLVPLLGRLVAGQPLREMVLVGLALAFATIPEELPIIITMVLALGGYRLSRRRAIVKRLQAVETLGAVTLIAADKTGTLTENEMHVAAVDPPDFVTRALELAVLCSDAAAPDDPSADPMERAMLRAAAEGALDVAALRATHSLQEEFSFDDERKLMSVVRRQGDGLRVAVKGAPEQVLARCDRRWTARGIRPLTEEARLRLDESVARMAADGLRVLALAERDLPPGQPTREEAESGLILAGLVGLADPPRPQAATAIVACRAAGIRPVMVTGDHASTARAVAARVGMDGRGRLMEGRDLDALPDEGLRAALGEVSVFARAAPAHKLRIVRAAQAQGHVVAVTGDGINDAPALAAADVGVAMGETGTDVAREAADIVLADDDFATLVHAVAEGRVLFANLRKGVRYYLACKVALISAMLLPALLAVPVPFAPVQIILMELLMDLAASAAFVAEPAEADLMRRPPRDPARPFMDRAMVGSILGAAAGLFAAVSVAYLLTWGTAPEQAGTVAFVTWLLGHVALALNLRSEREPLARLGVWSNRVMVAWGTVTAAVVLVAVLAPFAQGPLRTTVLDPARWALAVGAAVAGTFWLEALKWLRRERS